jgi:hypothetical protein
MSTLLSVTLFMELTCSIALSPQGHPLTPFILNLSWPQSPIPVPSTPQLTLHVLPRPHFTSPSRLSGRVLYISRDTAELSYQDDPTLIEICSLLGQFGRISL